MALTDLTIGTATDSSYVSLAEADAYLLFDPELSDDWGELEEEDKLRRLVGGRRRLDRLPWRGEPTGQMADPDAADYQKEAWPRTGLRYPDGTTVPQNVIPEDIVTANIILAGDPAVELASTLAADDSDFRAETIGPKSIQRFHQNKTFVQRLLPGGIERYISFWLEAPQPIVGSEVSGGEMESEFTTGKYEKTLEGFH